MNKKHVFFLSFKRALLGLFCAFSLTAFATEEGTSNKLIEYLAAEKVSLTVTNSDLRSFSMPITVSTVGEQKARMAAQKVLLSAKIDTLEGFLVTQRKKQEALKTRLKQFKQSSSSSSEALVLNESVSQVKALIQVNEKAIELILDNLALARQYQQTLDKREKQLILWEAAEEKVRIIKAKQEEMRRLEQSRVVLYEKNIELERSKKAFFISKAKGASEESALLLNNQSVLLIDQKMALLEAEIKLLEADYVYLKRDQDMKSLEYIIEVYEREAAQIEVMKAAFSNMQRLVANEEGVLFAEKDKEALKALANELLVFEKALLAFQETVTQALADKYATLKKQRAKRQHFEDYRQASWQGVMQQLMHVPLQFYQYLKMLVTKALDHYLWEDSWPRVLFWSILGVIAVCFGMMRHLLREVTQEKARSRFSGHLYDGALLLFYRSLPQLLIATLLITGLLLNQVSFAQIELLFHLFLIWLLYRQFKGAARLVLLERIRDDVPQHEMLLYRHLKWLFLMGAWSTALMIVGQELPLSFLLQDLFSRFFMLFLLTVSWVIWKTRGAFSELFHPWFHTKKQPFRQFGALLSILIPFSVLTTALIGLFGFVHIAWTLSRYQAYFLLVLTAYVLLRELLTDLTDYVSERMVSKLHNGWLWVEAVVGPLEKWLHFGLLLLGIFVVFRGFKNDWEMHMLSGVKAVGTYPILSGQEIHITLFSTIEAVIILLILIWLAKWTREFCYRWLYRGMVDAAIRNSVSIFTQYAVILLGAMLFLRVLGIDLTGMGMVLGGLAVGMGFGLRDFASNIIGGLMLLIERPVREGDLITLGEYEGRVSHIGIRSMRVSSWDHMEVLIPNAETFNKPVTNWTHQDGVVRTVLPIKVSRTDDTAFVQKLIFEVLEDVPDVLKDPPSQVFLAHIEDALVEFEVRYFINIQFNIRHAVRSKVLFGIMEKFQEAGIKAPIPPFRVELEKEDDDTTEGSTTT